MFILALLEQAEKSIVDVARQIRILEESNLVNELEFVVCLLRAMPSHRDILEDRLEVWPDFLMKKIPILFIPVFYHQDLRVWLRAHSFIRRHLLSFRELITVH